MDSTIYDFNLMELEDKAKELDKRLNSINDKEEKAKLIQSELDKTLGNTSPKIKPILNLTQEQINQIDKILDKDLNGNLFLNSSKIKSLGLSKEQISSITTALKSYNKIPLEVKDGSNQAIESIVNSPIMQKEIDKQDTILDKANMIINGSVEGRAWTFEGQNGFNIQFEWWGYGVKVPGWLISEMEWHMGNWGLSSAINVLVAYGIYTCGPYTHLCTGAAVVLYVGYWGFTWYNRSVCNNKGVRIWKSYVSNYYSLSC
jgi:hypothetical protein